MKPFIHFTIALVILVQLQQFTNDYFKFTLDAICILLILSVGISHGAIDNIIYYGRQKINNLRFIFAYVVAALLFGFLWILNFEIAIIGFLIMSAYHFGQSQFVTYKVGSRLISNCLYLFWGIFLLSFLLHFNISEVNQVFTLEFLSDKTTLNFLLENLYIAGIIALTFTASILIYLSLIKRISTDNFFIELSQIALILISFKFLPLLMGFTLYFIILHSLRVLKQEYIFIKSELGLKNNLQFIKLLIPFTTLSIVGSIVLLLIFNSIEINMPRQVIAIILIACITFPHTIVMDLFYAKNKDHINPGMN